MTDQDILEACTRIIRDLLADDSIVLTMETRRDQVDGWDSFTYVNFIAIAEMEFGVRFSVTDVESFENVGAIVRQTEALLP